MPSPVPSRIAAVVVTAAAAVAAPAVPASAAAVPYQVVTIRNTFAPSEITITQGGALELTNLDLERHDVTALDSVGGVPLFRSRTIIFGQRAVVEGVGSLEPSLYPFYCTVHSEMVGNLTVL